MHTKSPRWTSIIDLTSVKEPHLNALPCDVLMYLQLLDEAHNGRPTANDGEWPTNFSSAVAGLVFLREQCNLGNAYLAQTTLDKAYADVHPKDIWTVTYNLVLACVPPTNGQQAVCKQQRPAYRWETPRYQFVPLMITNMRAPPPPGWKNVNFAALPRRALYDMVQFMYRDVMHPAAHHPHLTSLTADSIRHYRDQFFYLRGLDLFPEDLIEEYFTRRPPVPAPGQNPISRMFFGPRLTEEERERRAWEEDSGERQKPQSRLKRLFSRHKRSDQHEVWAIAGGRTESGW